MNDNFNVNWIDHGREPLDPPDPNFPNGVVIDLSKFAGVLEARCSVSLPYPAKRCGVYIVKCTKCDQIAAISTAGRPDDPVKVILVCKAKGVT